MNDPDRTEHHLYGSPEWQRMPVWRRFITRFWFVIVLVVWVILFWGCAGDGRPETIEPRGDLSVVVENNNWLEVVLYTWINGQRSRLGNVATGSQETFVIPRAVADHPELRFLIDPIGSSRTHLCERVLVGTGQRIIIIVNNNLALTTVIVRE